MILCIDSGNTMINFALLEKGEVLYEFKCHNNPNRTADEYFSWLMPLLQIASVTLENIKHCLVCSVVPHTAMNLSRFAELFFGSRWTLFTSTHPALRIKIDTENPAQVGSDLVASALAAYYYSNTGAIVVDCGTATTVSCIDHKGNFLGVLIAPGFKTALDALLGGGAQLPMMNFTQPSYAIGRNSFDSINSGMFYGFSGLVENMISAAKASMVQEKGLAENAIKVIGTGGYISNISTPLIDLKDNLLLLKGLALFYEHKKNAEKRG